ncbi:hypothetical protein BCF33_1982 [Hasllibacter halocynthiae]|uniref:Beta-lactamase-related domain-containing protein n=1 Tax=Hasllibacter halocynthiae TaxID=595589 RepID=A0A2T0X2E5_9RHOB|nr:serine hydrolase [Hasllibacter halocynthiae]PRY93116.1 hypothetical protein BCF33_1982 [Hasllibacter halocynthiae]
MWRWIGRGALALVVVLLAAGIWQRERIGRLHAVLTLFDEERIDANFRDMRGAFETVPVDGGEASELPRGEPVALPPGVAEWAEARHVAALLAVSGGELVLEEYYRGADAEDLFVSWSMAKSVLSTLVGVLIEEGAIPSVDVAVTDYAPELAGGAYDGARLRDVLLMSSGVVFDEDYLDFRSDINRMGRVLGLGGSMDRFAAGLSERDAPPGTRWRYVSIDTHVIGMVARGATGRPVADLVGEKVFAPIGLEADPYYVADGHGVAFVLGGLNLRARDYARFGAMVAAGGAWNGRRVVPAAWIEEATAPLVPAADGWGYGYQWWVPPGAREGEVIARGVYGQTMLIDRARDVVVLALAADRGFREEGVWDDNLAALRALADAAAR